jgi:adenine-specific DNA methylase
MATKKDQLEQEVAKAVGAGRTVALETVDFNDPNRPKSCLEVDFPILTVNELAAIEASSGATKKPIYQLSKWWARRQPSVFRSILIAAATKAPEDRSHTAKLVWDSYYANHQKKGTFKHLKVADIFMGGGTTLVEGSRLGMEMIGNDLNPIAWFVVKQALTHVDFEEVKLLLADVEAQVKPQLMPYYYCDGPNGEKGKWTHLPTKRVMGPDFDPLSLTVQERPEYSYDGPEIVYTFWAKHGPCQVTGCGHLTPILNSPLMANKTLTVSFWEHACGKCGSNFHVESGAARMAPDAPLYVAPNEYPYSILDPKRGIVCPHCGFTTMVKLGKSKTKKVELSLLVHPQWIAGSPKNDSNGQPFGGSAQDDVESTSRWNLNRASTCRLLEVRGELPDVVTCPETHLTFSTGKEGGTVPKKSNYACGSCGTTQDILESIKPTKKTGPMAAYAVKAYSPARDKSGALYGGRFFAPFDSQFAKQYNAALSEWNERKDSDLAAYWTRSELPYGFMTHHLQGGVPNHGFTHWWTMFNPRQMLVHAQLIRAIWTIGDYSQEAREYVLGAMQQYLRNQNMFCFWNIQTDKLEPLFSNNNYHPKSTVIENSIYPVSVRGNWAACIEGLEETFEWKRDPWETVSNSFLARIGATRSGTPTSKSSKAYPGDPVTTAAIECGSATEIGYTGDSSVDLVITDPPFGGLLQYSELADFFYVWLRLVLKDKYPKYFGTEFTPKSLEVVSNKAREPEDADGFYQRLLTQSWREAHRILKPSGILAFTFHHSEHKPWVAVLESLFDAGFFLEATYPIRSDETKGEGEFGSKTIEFDIIHVCRKRTEEPTPVSWGRMRREVLAEVRQLQDLLENHSKEGLPAADLQVIRCGKALEYFSRHYGKVYVDEGRPISVGDALLGISQLIDEDANKTQEPPPVNAEPITRQFLRIFNGKADIARDQMHKFLRGSGMAPDEFEQRGWCTEKNKVFSQVNPLDFAVDWHGRHKRRLTSDMDQAFVLVGACFDGSGINASDTLKNENFKPHVALKPLLEWLSKRGVTPQTRNAASRALSIYNNWAATHEQQVRQMSLFFEEA